MNAEASAPATRDFKSILKRRWPYVISIGPAIILFTVYLAFALPVLYRSSATIMLEPSSVQRDLVDTTVATYATRQIEIVQSRVMTIEALKKLVAESDPYPNAKGWDDETKARQIIENTSFERVDPVTMKVLLESTAFSLHYDNPDPKLAAKTASLLSDLFLSYNQRSRAEAAQQTAVFLAEQADSITKELQAVDAQISQLKVKYGDAAPEAQLRNENGLERAQRDLENLQRDMRRAEDQVNMLQVQLSGISPNLVAMSGDLTDLNRVKAQLAEAEQRYTPDHPDVKRLRRAMQDLINNNAAANGKPGRPNNPDYLRVESQLNGAKSELAGLRASADRARSQIFQFQQNLSRSPIVEKEFNDAMRHREALQANFQQVQERLRTARMAQSFESESRGERFTLVRAPFPPRLPYSPNRIGMILLGLVLGLGLTAAVVSIAESMDASVRGASDLPTVGEVGVLGTIPVILTAPDRRRRNVMWASIAGAYGIALFFVGFTIVTAG